MTKEINLTIGERMFAAQLLNSFKGDMATLRSILDDIKGFAITDEERETYKFRQETGPEGIQFRWDDPEEKSLRPVPMNVETVDYLKKAIKSKSDAHELSILDAPMISLEKKLSE